MTDETVFTKEQVARRARKHPRTVEKDLHEPGCPLRWTHRKGRKVATTEALLESYLAWADRARPVAS